MLGENNFGQLFPWFIHLYLVFCAVMIFIILQEAIISFITKDPSTTQLFYVYYEECDRKFLSLVILLLILGVSSLLFAYFGNVTIGKIIYLFFYVSSWIFIIVYGYLYRRTYSPSTMINACRFHWKAWFPCYSATLISILSAVGMLLNHKIYIISSFVLFIVIVFLQNSVHYKISDYTSAHFEIYDKCEDELSQLKNINSSLKFEISQLRHSVETLNTILSNSDHS